MKLPFLSQVSQESQTEGDESPAPVENGHESDGDAESEDEEG